ncbi:MAG TPA: hypothetical protein HA254_01055 [Candidatus Diapherotrites archaeon]|uniref:Glycosyltransferase family 39 protein n=1 Tax=Candidatus Iainarchaeum sp. TaxID=3101447 RepID=A0A7J4IUM4_9ARCH|nr:hypothetical protein [Candidatus Diapherotrites archaeon]
MYFVAREFFKSEAAGEFASALFLGTKFIFITHFSGEYGWVLATALSLFTIYFMWKRNAAAFILFPAVFYLHPAIGLNLLLAIAVLFLFFKEKVPVTGLAISVIAATPALYMNYLPIITNLLLEHGGLAVAQRLDLLSLPALLPARAGIVPLVLLAVCFAFLLAKKAQFSREEKAIAAIMLSAAALSFGTMLFSVPISDKPMELVGLAVMLLCASFLAKFDLTGLLRPALVTAMLALLCTAAFFGSASMTHYRLGPKISLDEARFAEQFRGFDPSLSRALILSKGSGKIAEFAGKIPYDLLSKHNISTISLMYYSKSDYLFEKGKQEAQQAIVASTCGDCIADANVDYLVVNEDYFQKKFDYPVVFSYGHFLVYRKTQ